MKKNILSLFFFLLMLLNFNLKANAEVISGKINHDDINIKNQVVDFKTQKPIKNAKISIPELNYTTYSDENGLFRLRTGVSDKSVLVVEKDGYKVFSLTVDNNILKNSLKLGIEKSEPFDLQITSQVIHLGDNMFSSNSANCKEFRANASGHFFSQNFKRPSYAPNQKVVVKIGSIIGLDTKKAKSIGQNRIAKVYSSPMEVYVNGNLISTIEINQDNLEIQIPFAVLKEDNELVIKTGRNLFQTEYIDYDDCELANIRIEIKNKEIFARKK